jgi:uncharacterized protein YceK
MERKTLRLFLFSLLLVAPGCGTILMHTNKDLRDEKINVYRGVRLDYAAAGYVAQSEPLLSVACIFDLPLSAVADTLFFPYDITQIDKGERPERADPATFVFLKGGYSKDKSNVFYGRFIIAGADPKSFVVLSRDGWARDDHEAYRYDTTLGVEDISTFSVVKGEWAKDSRAYYSSFLEVQSWGKVDCDYSTLQILDGFYAKDANRAYYRGKPINDVDVASFRVIDSHHAEDNNFLYAESALRTPKHPTK